MPTHNRADLIQFAITSVLAQTEDDFELLVVGDGCTDRTADAVAGFGDARIRWFDLPKSAHFGYANRNIVLRQATGKYIAYVTDDDIVFPDHLALLAAGLKSSDADWIYSRPLWVTPDGFVVPFASNLGNRDELELFLTGRNHIPSTCVLHRRTCFAKYGYWPEDLPIAGDWQLWKRIIEGGRRANADCCVVPTALHFHAQWKGSETMVQVEAARALATRGGWWPATLNVPITPGMTEQRVFHELLSEEGYLDQLRRDVALVIDRLGWMQLDETPRSEAGRRDEVARVKQSLDGTQREITAARADTATADARLAERERLLSKTAEQLAQARYQLAAMQTSTSWRWTAPLRALARMLRG
jgi:hypothetical protein